MVRGHVRSAAEVLVRPHQIHPDSVNPDEDDHGRRAEIVNAAKDAAHRVHSDEAKAVVGLARTRHVSTGERDPGEHLDKEDDQGGTAEDVKPAEACCLLSKPGALVSGCTSLFECSCQSTIDPVCLSLPEALVKGHCCQPAKAAAQDGKPQESLAFGGSQSEQKQTQSVRE